MFSFLLERKMTNLALLAETSFKQRVFSYDISGPTSNTNIWKSKKRNQRTSNNISMKSTEVQTLGAL